MILCPGYLGYCPRNKSKDEYLKNSSNLLQAFKEYISPKRAPLHQRYLLLKKHGGQFYILFFLLPFLLFPFKYILVKYFK